MITMPGDIPATRASETVADSFVRVEVTPAPDSTSTVVSAGAPLSA